NVFQANASDSLNEGLLSTPRPKDMMTCDHLCAGWVAAAAMNQTPSTIGNATDAMKLFPSDSAFYGHGPHVLMAASKSPAFTWLSPPGGAISAGHGAAHGPQLLMITSKSATFTVPSPTGGPGGA